jgi:signal peptidase II
VRALAAGLVLVPLVDQTVKRLLRRRLGSHAVALGPAASVRVVAARIWLARALGRSTPTGLWLLWLLAAAPLAALGVLLPSSPAFAGLLLGGSLSHLLEAAGRGTVSDCLCVGRWLRFNLADVAITVGGLGLLAHLPIALSLALA